MKRIICLILCVFTLPLYCFMGGCNAGRENILKVYNLGEYMDEDVLDGFADWYYDETGETVEVSYKTYSTNEDMYTEIYKKHADYDVVCSSDYILSRMMKNDLLLPIDRDIVYGGKEESEVLLPEILQFMNDYENYSTDPSYTAQTRYSMPYMWGTFGIMYRNDYAPELVWDDLSWDVLFKSGIYENKRYMKNSIRDAYASAAIVAHASELKALSSDFEDYSSAEYQAKLKSVINDTSWENMQAVERTLKEQKNYLFAYESDDGKDDMAKEGEPNAYMGLFWSCDAGWAMDDGEGNYMTDLYYGVPKEGANVWVDSFVIPKYAKNEKAAQYFLKYLSTYDSAYYNRVYAGCSSPIKDVADDTESILRAALDVVKSGEEYSEDSDDYDEDVAYYADFFSNAEDPEDFGEMFIDMLFPSKEVLSRCAVMKDSDKDACIEMAKMWIRVKAS